MQAPGRMDASHVRDLAPREPLLGWLNVNAARLAIYLVIASFGVTAAALYIERPDGISGGLLGWGFGMGLLEWTLILVFYGGLLGIPGTAIWLLLVSQLLPETPVARRRAVALALSPLIQVFWLAIFLSGREWLSAALFGVFLPAGSAFVIRFRQRRPSSPFPAEEAKL